MVHLLVCFRILFTKFDCRLIESLVTSTCWAVFEHFCLLKIHEIPLLLGKQHILHNLNVPDVLDVRSKIQVKLNLLTALIEVSALLAWFIGCKAATERSTQMVAEPCCGIKLNVLPVKDYLLNCLDVVLEDFRIANNVMDESSNPLLERESPLPFLNQCSLCSLIIHWSDLLFVLSIQCLTLALVLPVWLVELIPEGIFVPCNYTWRTLPLFVFFPLCGSVFLNLIEWSN